MARKPQGRLKLYRRHLAACPHKHKGRRFDTCKCPIWVQGTWAGQVIRKSLDVDTWAAAETKKQEIQDGITPQPQPKTVTIEHAAKAFIADCQARNLNRSTFKKYELLATRLQDFAAGRRIVGVDLLTHEQAVAFRGTWKGSPRTLSKTLERARAIGKFAVQNGWLQRNPFEGIKAPQVKVSPRLPFSEKEIQSIVARAKDDRELAFILTLRHTGLRIGDASLLRTSQFSEGRIFLYTTKAGTPVSIKIPPALDSLLKALEPRGGYFFVRGDSVSMHTCADLWRRRIKILCKEAAITSDHPHRFRHSLAADLLSRGVTVENVAAILGNSPTIVVKHYSQWISSRQEALDAALQSTWKPQLALVKR